MANEKRQKSAAEVEAARRKKEEQARRGRRRNRQLIGIALFILIVVGGVSIVRSGVGLARTFIDNAPEREAYQQRISTMVWTDVLPFENPEQADPNAIRQAAIWGAFGQIGAGNVEHDEIGSSIVPLQEVNRYIAELFGPAYLESMPAPDTFRDAVQALTYTFDAERNAYLVPATSLQPLYLPNVVDIRNESNGIKRVTVGYVSTSGSNEAIGAPTIDLEYPDRYMDYIFQRDGNDFYLVSLQRNNTLEIPVPPASSSLPAQSLPVAEPDISSTPPGEELLPPQSLPAEEESGSNAG